MNIEFGYELIAIIPYAYWLYKNNLLTKTTSNKDTACLYYFSPNHEEVDERRHSRMWRKVRDMYDNGYIHRPTLNTTRWEPPPYKEHFSKDRYPDSDKPYLVVCNKYNVEWKKPPVNFLDIETLRWIFETFQDKYDIIYNRFTSDMGYDDTVDTMDLGEWDIVRKYNVRTIQDLKTPDYSYNELQTRLYASCNKFITVQGGTSVLASYFGGDNIIFACSGMEIKKNSYENWYHLFANSEIHHAKTYQELMERAKSIL